MKEESIKKTKEAANEFSKIIPEIFLDIICRIVPGIIFLVVVMGTKPNSLTLKWYYDLPVIVAFAYSISLSLDCFSNWLLHSRSIRWSWAALKKHATKAELAELKKEPDGSEKSNEAVLESLRSQHKRGERSEKGVLIKILAEERFFKVMALGLPISVVFFLIQQYRPPKTWFVAILFLVVSEIVFFVGARDRNQRAVTRTFFWWKNK